jgi:hypothetical protein
VSVLVAGSRCGSGYRIMAPYPVACPALSGRSDVLSCRIECVRLVLIIDGVPEIDSCCSRHLCRAEEDLAVQPVTASGKLELRFRYEAKTLHHSEGCSVMQQSEGHDIAHPYHVPAVGQRTCPSLSRVAVPPGVWQQSVSQLHLYTAEHAAVSQLDRAHRHAVATQEPPPKAPATRCRPDVGTCPLMPQTVGLEHDQANQAGWARPAESSASSSLLSGGGCARSGSARGAGCTGDDEFRRPGGFTFRRRDRRSARAATGSRVA